MSHLCIFILNCSSNWCSIFTIQCTAFTCENGDKFFKKFYVAHDPDQLNYLMKKIIVLAAVLFCGFGISAMAQIFDDNFADDSSLSSSYLNINNINSGVVNEWAFTANSQLQLTTATSGKVDELVGQFSAQTLSSIGEYVTFTASFNSPSLTTSGTGGSLLIALDNSGGVGLLSAGSASESPTATTGSTTNYIGYAGMIDLNSTPHTSTKILAKTGNGNNDLAYVSDALPETSLLSGAAGANLNTADNFQAIFTVENIGGGQDQITSELFDATASTAVDTYTVTTTTIPATAFDTFDIGVYTGSEASGYNINLTDLAVTSNVPVPEPSTMALAGLGGLVMAGFARRFRRRKL